MKTLTIHILLALLCLALLSCADNPTAPDTLTETEIEFLIDARVAEELAKMNNDDALTPQEIASIALKSTVYLRVKTASGNYYGSGFVVGKGLIATCEHVLDGMTSGTVEPVINETKYPVKEIIAIDEAHDLAILRVSDFAVPPLPLGDSDTVQIGETIYAAGNPKKWKGTFSTGVVNGIHPKGNHFISGKIFHISAPISPGSSGGPVLNNKGEVIGVVDGQEFDTQNLNFAVPVNHLKSLLSTLK